MFWQISPPTAPIPTEQLRDFKSGLDVAWQNATSTVAPELLALGNDLWEGMAVIVVVWTGLRIAFSGDIQPWDFVRLIIGLWIPWVLLQFYNQPIPGMAMSFPVMISSGGTWVQAFFIGDMAYDMQTAMGNLVDTLGVSVQTAYEEGGVWDLVLSGGHAALSLIGGTLIIVLVVISLLILFAITYAPGDLGSTGRGHPDPAGADLHPLAGVRSAGVFVLGMVQGAPHLLHLWSDRGGGHARIHRCQLELHRPAGNYPYELVIAFRHGPLGIGGHPAGRGRDFGGAPGWDGCLHARHRGRSGRERVDGSDRGRLFGLERGHEGSDEGGRIRGQK